MALSILDGNQSATTLSTIVTSGQHIPAHTVVSLGTQAIANITSAVSGSSVTFGLVGGTVTANNFTLTNVLQYDGSHYFLKVGGVATTGGTSFPVYVAGSVTANPTGTQTIAGTVTANIGDATSLVGGGYSTLTDLLANDTIAVRELPAISGTVTIGSLPAISGTVTANLANVVTADSFWGTQAIKVTGGGGYGIDITGIDSNSTPTIIQEGGGIPVYPRDNSSLNAPFPISGTVTIGSALPTGTNRIGVVTIGGGTVTIGAGTAQIGSVTASISGTVPISISSVTIGNSVTIGSLPAISGTVTANSSNGSLTTRFGSVTTANTAFATSAVTNANRKYLLIQNVTTASNAITVGIGFTPTTTQGIQLSSGAGLTFEGSYIPTGAVNILSSVTASCFTILEA
jgi:hypothetical protein